MTGTVLGGKKAAQANLKKDSAFYKKIGALGGKSGKAQGTIKGFQLNPEHTRLAGAKGGRISRKGHKYLYTKEGLSYYIENSSQSVVTFKEEL